MSAQNNDDEKRRERELRDLEYAEAILQPRIDAADKLFSQAINCLLLGNSGGALATLGFIGTIAKDGTFPKVLLCPLFFFLLGLLLMGIGILVALGRERRAIIRNQGATNVWDTFPQDKSPLQRVGLASGDRRMIMTVLSGCCFIAGAAVGFGILLCKGS